MSPQTYHRTLILVEVLGDEPYAGDVTDLAYDITDGPFSGMELMRSSAEVDAEAMATLLVMQGSDPSFLIPEAE